MPIDPSSHVPIFVQIVEHIRQSVAVGIYRSEEMLPSLRQLALDLSVNPNTVQRAYEQLEREGLVVPRRGVGVFVTKEGDASARRAAEASVREAFVRGVRAGLAAGLAAETIRSVFEDVCDQIAAGRERTR